MLYFFKQNRNIFLDFICYKVWFVYICQHSRELKIDFYGDKKLEAINIFAKNK